MLEPQFTTERKRELSANSQWKPAAEAGRLMLSQAAHEGKGIAEWSMGVSSLKHSRLGDQHFSPFPQNMKVPLLPPDRQHLALTPRGLS